MEAILGSNADGGGRPGITDSDQEKRGLALKYGIEVP